MKKPDDVFLFTIVDLLLQLLFLGLVLYSIGSAEERSRPPWPPEEMSRLGALMHAQGFASLAELTDELSRLGPVKPAAALVAYSDTVGGADTVRARLARLAQKEGGVGRPPCIYDVNDGKRVSVPVAQFDAWDDSIGIRNISDTLRAILKSRGAAPPARTSLSFAEFAREFRSLAPGKCWYRALFFEHTDKVFARDAVNPIFQFRPVRIR